MQMTDIIIPPAALEAGARTLCSEQRLFWHGLRSEAQEIIRREARDVFIAMIEAWLGGVQLRSETIRVCYPALILPLPMEASDE